MREVKNKFTLYEIFIWVTISILAASVYIACASGPIFQNDSYQYLSVAGNILSGNGIETSIVHFDTERSHGIVPAPMTTFPPGYPFVIAVLSTFGISDAHSGVIINLFSLGSLVILLFAMARIFQLRPQTTRFMVLIFSANSLVVFYTANLMSESLFASLSFAALFCFVYHNNLALERPPSWPRAQLLRASLLGCGSLFLGNILIGLAFSVRYAGFFLFAAALFFYGARLIIRRDLRSVIELSFMGVSASIISLIFIRNFMLTGIWTGGNEKFVRNSIYDVLKTTVVSFHHLFFGETVPARFGVIEILFTSGIIAFFIAAARESRIHFRPKLGMLPQLACRSGAFLLLCYVVIYTSGMIYLGMTSVISFGPRMFYPLIPVIIILGAIILDPAAQSWEAGPSVRRWSLALAAAAMAGGYLAVNIRALSVEPPSSPHRDVARLLNERSKNGQSIVNWLSENAAANAVILSSNGQATAYALGRPAVSLVSSQYSDVQWDEFVVRNSFAEFGAELLILYTGGDQRMLPVQRQSPFLAGLIAGVPSPWLYVAIESDNVKVFSTKPTLQSAEGPTSQK